MQTEFNMTEAAALAGVSRRTFYNHIESKPISTKRNQNDEKIVELSELKRVYGDENILSNLKKMQEENSVQSREHTHNETANSVKGKSTSDVDLMKARLEALENEKNLIQEQAKRERELMQEERDFLRKRLEESQEGQKRITLLLESHGQESKGDGKWEKSFQALEKRIANQEQAVKEQRLLAEKRLRIAKKLKQDLDLEKNKSFWQRLFG